MKIGSGTSTAADTAAHLSLARPEPHTLLVRRVAAGQKTLLRVYGPVDVATTPALAEALQPYRASAGIATSGGSVLILDLRAVDYIESPGLRLLISLGEELRAGRGEVRLVVAHPSRVERTLGLIGLDRQLPVYFTPREAWQGASRVTIAPMPAATGELA
jgi:anti-anti-sigma factor